ncbi:unnamed protein product [Soboliphyme baturini]|uniref:Phage protein n=1 Tax=Soboliphyme baturini TaxID=241478 RepID=A0A183J2E1_9BILA|nr:unnamed protein product [Soboliphyme baturini]
MDIDDGEYWIDSTVLLGFCVGFRIISYLVLWLKLKNR